MRTSRPSLGIAGKLGFGSVGIQNICLVYKESLVVKESKIPYERKSTDDKHIAPIDEGGVALAAIKALNDKDQEKDQRIKALEERLQKLEEALTARNGVKQ